VGNLTSLTFLDLAGNLFSGTLPTSIRGLQGLLELSLHYNALPLKVPSEIGLLRRLQVLTLGSLESPVPTELIALTGLRTLAIVTSSVPWSIPKEISRLDQLEAIALMDCQLTGTIPSEIADLQKLSALVLLDNNVTGPIPTELGRLTGLAFLDLSYNQLTGTLPSELGLLTNLEPSQNVSFHGNNIGGSVPAEICDAMMEGRLFVSVNCDEVECADCGCICDVVKNYDEWRK
jgi:Leucine-rich repeat (LRR) protein